MYWRISGLELFWYHFQMKKGFPWFEKKILIALLINPHFVMTGDISFRGNWDNNKNDERKNSLKVLSSCEHLAANYSF